MRGLIIKSPWIEKILSGEKTWDLRSTRTNMRGRISLIKSGSGKILGTCDLIDVIGPLSSDGLIISINKHCVPYEILKANPKYRQTYAWVLKNPIIFDDPKPYSHPSGAVIWVKLD